MNTRNARAIALSLAVVALSPAIAFAADAATAKAEADYMKMLNGFAKGKGTNLCYLLKKDEVARYFGPVDDGRHESSGSTCTWIAHDSSGDLVTVTRGPRSEWAMDVRVGGSDNKPVPGLGEHAIYSYSPQTGTRAITKASYNAQALNARGVTGILLYGHGTRDSALALLKIAMQR